jgi:hypothetical protein
MVNNNCSNNADILNTAASKTKGTCYIHTASTKKILVKYLLPNFHYYSLYADKAKGHIKSL